MIKKLFLFSLFTCTALFALDGQTIFTTKCKNCHGIDGKLSALGHSSAIAGWEVSKITDALQGYKSGTRNTNGMGEFMKNEMSKYSEEEISSLALYISKLK
jgi:cytochrome c